MVTRFVLLTSVVLFTACSSNTPGPKGDKGDTGAVGPQGPKGEQGPAGPAGASYDAGIGTEFLAVAGYTTSKFSGDLGGVPGANAKCAEQFAGSYFCTKDDFDRTNPVTGAPSGGAWVDGARAANGLRSGLACTAIGNGGAWGNGNGGVTGFALDEHGAISSDGCSSLKPLVCCRATAKSVFRGFTAAKYSGDLGGSVGANAKCAAEFPGSGFCTIVDWQLANPQSAVNAWVDDPRSDVGVRAANSCSNVGGWVYGGDAGLTGVALIAANGGTTGENCSLIKPLACCNKR